MRVIRSTAASCVGTLMLHAFVCVRSAAADPAHAKTASLSWERAAGTEVCLSATELTAAIEAKLGKSTFVSRATSELLVEAQVVRKNAELVATVAMHSADGESLGTRLFRSRDLTCAELSEILPLAIALMVDPDAESRTPPPVTPAAEPVKPEPEPVKPEPVKPEPSRPSALPNAPRVATARGTILDAHLSPAVGLGFLPAASLGVLASATAELPGIWALTGGVMLLLPEVTTSAATLRAGLVFAGICPLRLHVQTLHAWGCAVVELGAFQTLSAVAHVEPFVAGGLELQGAWVLGGPLSLRANAAVAGPVLVDRSAIADAEPAKFSIPYIHARATLGLGLHFE